MPVVALLGQAPGDAFVKAGVVPRRFCTLLAVEKAAEGVANHSGSGARRVVEKLPPGGVRLDDCAVRQLVLATRLHPPAQSLVHALSVYCEFAPIKHIVHPGERVAFGQFWQFGQFGQGTLHAPNAPGAPQFCEFASALVCEALLDAVVVQLSRV